jgi:hypothetical protein
MREKKREERREKMGREKTEEVKVESTLAVDLGKR